MYKVDNQINYYSVGEFFTEEQLNERYKGQWVVAARQLGKLQMIASTVNEKIANDLQDMYLKSGGDFFADGIDVIYIEN